MIGLLPLIASCFLSLRPSNWAELSHQHGQIPQNGIMPPLQDNEQDDAR
jgi:hypothetical protein